MKILFTKTGIEHEVSEKLETGFSCDFKDFIAIEKNICFLVNKLFDKKTKCFFKDCFVY